MIRLRMPYAREVDFFHDDCYDDRDWPVPRGAIVEWDPDTFMWHPAMTAECRICGEDV